MEKKIVAAFKCLDVIMVRAHGYDPKQRHGFISSQCMGINVFHSIPNDELVGHLA